MDRRPLYTFLFAVTAIASIATSTGFAAAAPSRSDASLERSRKLQVALDQVVAAGAPAAVALRRDGERTTTYHSGYGNLATKTPVRPSDRFRIGSLTKTFVATVALQLVGENKLSLEDSIERWLPSLVPNGENITVKQLLNHTSGLFEVFDDPRILRPYLQGNFGYYWSPRAIVKVAVSHKQLFEPGARWSYSSTNYIVLGLIIEAATTKSLKAEIETRIIKPLRLGSTSFPTGRWIPGHHAHGYVFTPKRLDVTTVSASPTWAAGNMVSTLDDVAVFYRALLRGELLSPNLLQAMQTTVPALSATPRLGKRGAYGLGLLRFQSPCGRIAWGHEGQTAGYLAQAYSSPNGSRQAVVLVNTDNLNGRGRSALRTAIRAAWCG